MKVEPIKDEKKLNAFLKYLKGTNYRDWMMAKMQLNTGLRISDVVSIKVSDILNEKKKFKSYFALHEEKTNKSKKISFSEPLKKDLLAYINENALELDDYLFTSRKSKDGAKNHITTVQAYRVLKAAADAVGIEFFGTHSLRKTFGYKTYINTGFNVALIQSIFNHGSQRETLIYIGMDQEEKDEVYTTNYI